MNGKTLDRGLSGAKNAGCVIGVYGTLIVTDNSTDKNGIITGGYNTGDGGGISISNSGRLDMYAGNITSNRALCGAGVAAYNGTFNLYGGKISQNTARDPLVNGKIASYGSVSGGGISVSKGSSLNFYDGEISGNMARDSGGGIYNAYEGNVTMSGGSILKNQTTGNIDLGGGGIFTFGNLKLTGGTIQNNNSDHVGSGVFYGGNATNIANPSEYIISGTVRITGNKCGELRTKLSNVCLSDFPKIAVEEMASGALIGISAPSSQTVSYQISKINTNQQNLQYFFADDDANYHLEWDDTNRYIKLVNGASGNEPTTHKHALNVGCDESITAGGAEVTFNHKLSTDATGKLLIDGTPQSRIYSYAGMVSGYAYEVAPGNYYLDGDCVLDNPIAFKGTSTETGTVNLCLNGHRITLKSGVNSRPIFYNNIDLNLTDCSEEKTGTITGGNVKNNGNSYASYGGGIFINSGSLNLFGGNISGNQALCGGGIYQQSGTINMYGGTVSGNTSTESGGGIYTADGNFILHGGKITGNTAGTAMHYGGGVNSGGKFEMYGGEISGNRASSGAGVVIQNSAENIIQGGEIKKTLL